MMSVLAIILAAAQTASALEVSAVDGASVQAQAEWLRTHHLPPADYLAERIRRHPLVILGEQHQDRRMLSLVSDSIGMFYNAGLRVIALEIVDTAENARLEKLVTAEVFDRGLQLEIAGAAAWHNWNAKEEWDLLEAVWDWNRRLPPGAEKLLVAGISDRRFDRAASFLYERGMVTAPGEVARIKKMRETAVDGERFMADEVSKLVKARRRTLVLIGLNHAFTRYRQAYVKGGRFKFEITRFANHLHKRHGKALFSVLLHFGQESPKRRMPKYGGEDPALPDFLESLFSKAGMRRGGFDLGGSPIGGLRDSRSDYFHFLPRYDLASMGDGYLYLGPLKDRPGCTCIKDFVSADTFRHRRAYFEILYDRKFASVAELNDMLCPGTVPTAPQPGPGR